MIFKLRSAREGGHVRTRVFVGDALHGTQPQFALAGELVMRPEEWLAFIRVVRAGGTGEPCAEDSVLSEGEEETRRAIGCAPREFGFATDVSPTWRAFS